MSPLPLQPRTKHTKAYHANDHCDYDYIHRTNDDGNDHTRLSSMWIGRWKACVDAPRSCGGPAAAADFMPRGRSIGVGGEASSAAAVAAAASFAFGLAAAAGAGPPNKPPASVETAPPSASA